MQSKVTFKIDGKTVTGDPKDSVRKIALANGIDIPGMCAHPELKKGASCRTCVVKVVGQKGMISSCSLIPEEGMEVLSQDPEVFEARRENLELLAGQHKIECLECVLHTRCPLLDNFRKYKVSPKKFENRKQNRSVEKFEAIRLDHSKCIDCRNCVEICPVGYLEVSGTGTDISISVTKDPSKPCIDCGLCINVCPVGALESEGEMEVLSRIKEDLSQDNKLLMIVSPVVVSAISQELGAMTDDVTFDTLSDAIKQLGVSKVYNLGVGSDVYFLEVSRLMKQNLTSQNFQPLISSHCRAWVNYVKQYFSDLSKYLIPVKTDIEIMVEAVKDLYQNDQKIKIVVVVPEVSQKKYCQTLPDHTKPDYVITTRELGHWLRKAKVKFDTKERFLVDDPFANSSTCGDILSVSGGLTQGLIKVLSEDLTHLPSDSKFKRVFEVGLEGFEDRKVVTIENQSIKLVVANGITQGQKYLEMLQKDPKAFDFLEVTVCPGGAVGGGGQPIPTNPDIRKQRLQKILDLADQKEVRCAQHNYSAQKILEDTTD